MRKITWSHECTSQSKASICVYKTYTFVIFLKWPMVCLDKTLIHRLVSFIAALKRSFWPSTVWSPLKLIIWIQILQCFHQKPSFLFDWRKKYRNILDDVGVSKLSGHFNLKVNECFKEADVVITPRCTEGVVRENAVSHLDLVRRVVKVVICGESQNNADLSV